MAYQKQGNVYSAYCRTKISYDPHTQKYIVDIYIFGNCITLSGDKDIITKKLEDIEFALHQTIQRIQCKEEDEDSIPL